MTKEELEKEARKYVKQNYCEICVMADDCQSGCIDCFTVQAYLASAEPREKQIADLEKENAELRKEWQEQVQKATDEGFARTLQTNQLSKAKEIIKTFLGFAEAFGYSPSMDKFIAEAEQFLNSEVKNDRR